MEIQFFSDLGTSKSKVYGALVQKQVLTSILKTELLNLYNARGFSRLKVDIGLDKSKGGMGNIKIYCLRFYLNVFNKGWSLN